MSPFFKLMTKYNTIRQINTTPTSSSWSNSCRTDASNTSCVIQEGALLQTEWLTELWSEYWGIWLSYAAQWKGVALRAGGADGTGTRSWTECDSMVLHQNINSTQIFAKSASKGQMPHFKNELALFLASLQQLVLHSELSPPLAPPSRH